MQLIDAITMLRNVAENTRKKPASETYSHQTNTAALLFSELAAIINEVEKKSNNSDPIRFTVSAVGIQFIIHVNDCPHMSEILANNEEPSETLLKLSTIFEEQLWDDYSTHLTKGNTVLNGRTRLSRKRWNIKILNGRYIL